MERRDYWAEGALCAGALSVGLGGGAVRERAGHGLETAQGFASLSKTCSWGTGSPWVT